jgi:hypothetical protein
MWTSKIRFCRLRVSQPCLAIATSFIMCTIQTETFPVLPPSVVRIWVLLKAINVTLFVRSIDSVSKVSAFPSVL